LSRTRPLPLPSLLSTPAHAVALALALLAAPAAARAEVKERVAAVINGKPVPLSDVVERAQPELQRLQQQGLPGPELERRRTEWLKRALDQLVDDRLIEAEAHDLGVEVGEDEVQKQLEALAKQNNLDVPAFKEAIEAQGMEFETLRDTLKRQALQFRLLQYKVKPRKVSDEEVQAAWAAQNSDPEMELKVRNLFVPIAEGGGAPALAAARATVEQALARLARGEEFAVVARDLSAAPSAHEGGSIGWLRRGTLFAEADRALARLSPGETTPPIKNVAGLHLFHLDERRPVPPRPLAEVQEDLRARIANDSIAKERENYLRALRKSAQIDLKL
jgi:peptidyl-prolyl cis-trans isomerase SurA